MRIGEDLRMAVVGKRGISATAGNCARSSPTSPTPTGRVRAKGGGRKKLTSKDPTLLRDLDALVEPTTRGDPRSPLR